ncbi:MAG: ABC transporter ATP-binding protein [Dehalobacterium sp.]
MDNLLEVKNLKTYFNTLKGTVPAVDGVDFSVGSKQTLGIVGESGCGKSITSLSIMRLVSNINGKIVDGSIRFKGEDLLKKSEKEMRAIRGNEISMIFQEPMTSLNPVFTIGRQISEALEVHQNLKGKEAKEKAVEMLKLVGIPSAARRYKEYPHQMSGGMRQRVMIAIALSCNPQLLIADEPTTALDVTIQAQIMELMQNLKNEFETSIILISHDMGIIAEMAEWVMIMYAGKVMEYGDVHTVFKEPRHPYTVGLLNSIPRIGDTSKRLGTIEGVVPNLLNMPQGCRFHPRCPQCKDICRTKEPQLIDNNGHKVRCLLYNAEE